MGHSMVSLIERKRDGGTLRPDEIEWIIGEFTADAVPDYQMAAMLMAIFQRSFDADELAAWTKAMLHSGETLALDAVTAPKVDKHSTGGVGDKVSIPLAPMVAACGVAVPMMSGRGLGHTGGTLDKLESIPGFRTALDPPEFASILEKTGLVLAGQSESLVPADRRIYALRDATATVPSLPLIASSIMSKKLAEDLDGLVLDVKVGSGAFMRAEEDARRLAETMVAIGSSNGTATVAVLTSMEQPLGRAVGNACEIAESVAVLRGEGPADLVEITMRLGVEMLLLGGVAGDVDDASSRLQATIDTGSALDKLVEVVEAQGGDPAVIHDTALLAQPRRFYEITAGRSGVVSRCDALAVGRAAVALGAGRQRKEDSVDHAVSIELLAKVGDEVAHGDALARIGYNDTERFEAALPLLTAALGVGVDADPGPLIIGEVR